MAEKKIKLEGDEFPFFFIKELIRVIHKSFADAIHSNLHIVSSVTFLAHPIVKCRHQ